MQVAKGPYKCVTRQLRMTCEPRSSGRTPPFCQISQSVYPHGTSADCRRDTSGGMATGQPHDACEATKGGIPQGALTTDLQPTSAHWLVALAKSSSKGLPKPIQRPRRRQRTRLVEAPWGRDH